MKKIALLSLISVYNIYGMSGEFINKVDELGRTPMLYAAEHDQTDLVELLINKSSDINAQCNNGWSALMWASKNNNLDLAKLLLDHKCDIRLKNKGGHTAEFYASDKQIKKLLGDASERLDFIEKSESESKTNSQKINLFKKLNLREINGKHQVIKSPY